MKSMFKGYYPYSDEEFKTLWGNATFVFDSNILLELYTYSDSSFKDVLSLLCRIKDKVWIPYHVGWEFFKNKQTYIAQRTVNDYSENIKEIKKTIEAGGKKIQNNKKPVEQTSNKLYHDKMEVILSQLDQLNSELEKQHTESYKKISHSTDPILQEILDLFDGKIGEPFENSNLAEVEEEAEKRHEKNIPPGYKDDGKVENKYGDYYIWKQIIAYAKANKKSIIFITNDQKEDWVEKVNGRKIGPRPQLLEEFLRETKNNQLLYIYTGATFFSKLAEYFEYEIKEETLSEVKQTTKTHEPYLGTGFAQFNNPMAYIDNLQNSMRSCLESKLKEATRVFLPSSIDIANIPELQYMNALKKMEECMQPILYLEQFHKELHRYDELSKAFNHWKEPDLKPFKEFNHWKEQLPKSFKLDDE